MPKDSIGWLVGIILIPLAFAIVAAILLEGFRGFLKQLWVRWFEGRIRAVWRSIKHRFTLDPSEVVIALRETNGFVLDMSGSIPQVRVWLQITNNSRFNLALDRLLISVKNVEPILLGYDDGIFERIDLPRKHTVEGLCYFSYLSSRQAEQIAEHSTYIHNLSQWQTRIRVEVQAFLYSPWAGWVTTGKRMIFHHDLFPIEGTPPKRAVPLLPEDERKLERKQALKGTLSRIASSLTTYTLGGNFDYDELMGKLTDDLSTLRVEWPDLYFRVNKIMTYLGDGGTPRNAGFVNENLITPLMIDARRYFE